MDSEGQQSNKIPENKRIRNEESLEPSAPPLYNCTRYARPKKRRARLCGLIQHLAWQNKKIRKIVGTPASQALGCNLLVQGKQTNGKEGDRGIRQLNKTTTSSHHQTSTNSQ